MRNRMPDLEPCVQTSSHMIGVELGRTLNPVPGRPGIEAHMEQEVAGVLGIGGGERVDVLEEQSSEDAIAPLGLPLFWFEHLARHARRVLEKGLPSRNR